MENSKTKKRCIIFPTQPGLHEMCPYNPECHSEIVTEFLNQFPREIQRIINWYRLNHQNQKFTEETVCDELKLSLCQVKRLLTIYGYSPKQVLDLFQLHHVLKQKQEYPHRPLGEALQKAGISNRYKFYRLLAPPPPPATEKIKIQNPNSKTNEL